MEYESVFFPRENNKAPGDFKQRSGHSLGKAPVLVDSSPGQTVTLKESGAITEYLLEKYDKEGRLFGGDDVSKKEKIRMWIHAAEGTFLIHALAITYARWNIPKSVDAATLKEMEKGLAVNVGKDLDWLESEIGGGRFLVGEGVSAADVSFSFLSFVADEGRLGRRGIG